jgi:hypothetical protein
MFFALSQYCFATKLILADKQFLMVMKATMENNNQATLKNNKQVPFLPSPTTNAI